MKKQQESRFMLALFVAFVISIVVIFPGTTTASPPAFVEKTGQTVSYAEGDDGDLQAGVALPIPRFTDKGDGTVTDNLTRLIWLKNANCFGARNWYDALSAANGLADGSCGLMDGSVPGDWRLPNIRELSSLVHYGFVFPTLSNAEGTDPWSEGDPFTGVLLSFYWASTSGVYTTSRAWGVRFDNGVTGGDYKSVGHYVWPVRGGRTFDTIEIIE